MRTSRCSLLIAGLMVLSGTTCSTDSVVIGINVINLPSDTSALFVSSVLDNGTSAQSATFLQQLNHFTIQVPISKIGSGNMVISASALASDRCKLASGRTDIVIRSDNTPVEAELKLIPLTAKQCTQIKKINPPVGPVSGGIPVSIDGENFSDGTLVTIAGTPATNIQVISPTKITAILPVSFATVGAAPVSIKTPEGGSATRSDLFSYYQLNFQSSSFPVGVQPSAIATADLNNDTKKDVVVANYGSANVSVLLGDGTGQLGTMNNSNSATGSCPRALHAADYDGDGYHDLIVVNECSNNVSVMIGSKNGLFMNRVEYPADTAASSVPNAIAAGDLTGDGKVDLAITNLGTKNVALLTRGTAATFTGPTSFALSASPLGVAIGDFNSDGKNDLAVSLYGGNSVSILKNLGAGSFSVTGTNQVTSKPDCVTIGDFNQDGRLDLAVANNGAPVVSILIGNGDGTFAPANNFQAGDTPYSIVVEDFTGDGRADLAVANYGSNSVSLLVGDGVGGFISQSSFVVGKNPHSVAAADFNLDGKQDIVVANSGDNSITVLLNKSK